MKPDTFWIHPIQLAVIQSIDDGSLFMQIEENKKLAKIKKAIGEETMQELEALDAQALKNRIAQAEQSIQDTKDELEANEGYKNLKESLKAASEGFKEVKKRQRGIIDYCVELIRGGGDVNGQDEEV